MITIICVGKIKEKYFKEAILEYQKRISKYHKLNIIEVEDFENENKDIVLSKEKDKILRHIKPKDYIIALDIKGDQLSSEKLALKIDKLFLNHSNLVFIIGGSYGLHDDLKKNSNCLLSFSNLTFPHQLFRVILLEQIYRSFKIINNETYHK